MRQFSESDILYMDDCMIAVHKRAGLAVQSARLGQMDLEHAVLGMLAQKRRAACDRLPYLAVVHRLDQPVEGIVLFALTKEAAADLSAQVSGKNIKKEYLAVVSPIPKERSGTLEDYLLKDGKTNSSRVVPKGTSGAKRSLLEYKVIDQQENRALVKINLMTGRHHQIRVQLSSHHMPILGDEKYGSAEKGHGSIALCACRITCYHPVSKKKMNFVYLPEAEIFQGFSAITGLS